MRIIDGYWQNNTNNQYSKKISEIECKYESQKFSALQASALVRLKFKKYFDVVIFQILFLILPTAGGILGPQVEAGLALVRRVISLVARKMLGPGNTTVRTLHAEKRGACATIFQGKY